MSQKDIPQEAIDKVAAYINDRSNKRNSISVVKVEGNPETPQIFEILPFQEIDNGECRFYAVDGSYNSQEFYNGLCVGLFNAGYVCYHRGRQVCLNDKNDHKILGKAYYPQRIIFTNEQDRQDLYDELIAMRPVRNLLNFFGCPEEEVFPYLKEAVCRNLSSLLGFCQEVLEWALVYEILMLDTTSRGDFILRDGTLRSLNIKQEHLVKLARLAHEKGVFIVAVTKKSPIKLELSYTFKQIDDYLQDKLKYVYNFRETDQKKRKLCCWLMVPEQVLSMAYNHGEPNNMYIKQDVRGGRGFGVFHAARLDYVEKLQNYDWLVTDLNIFDVMPGIENKDRTVDIPGVKRIHYELTRLTQDHYILGYPYPLVEAHNFVTLKKDFREEVINRVKLALYMEKQMDHIDIENLFLDTHDRF